MKIYLQLYKIILLTLLVKSAEGSTDGSCSIVTKENDQICGKYCYQVVKPLLNYAASIRSKEVQFAELHNKIRDSEAIIVNLKETIKQKELYLTQQIELTTSYKTNIGLQDRQRKSYEAQISQLHSEVKSKDLQINEKDKEIRKLQSQLGISIDKDNQLSLNAAKIKQLEAKFSVCQANSIASICLGKITDVYTINVPDIKPFSVLCDSKLIGSGGIVIQRRINGTENFNRNWEEYKKGFGDLRGEFFIGLEKLHLLTQSQPNELYIHLENFQNETRYAQYSNFLIGNETDLFEIKQIGNYSGNAGNSLQFHINMKFSTWDRDNDYASGNCAIGFESGWWFKKCYNCNLNGRYTAKDVGLNGNIIAWNAWHIKPLKFVEMMIRPKSFGVTNTKL